MSNLISLDVLKRFDAFLFKKRLKFEAVIVGGIALEGLRKNWLNDRARLTIDFLAEIKGEKLVFAGKAVRFTTLARELLILTKIGAIADRANQQDLEDLRSIAVTLVEFDRAMLEFLAKEDLKLRKQTQQFLEKARRALFD